MKSKFLKQTTGVILISTLLASCGGTDDTSSTSTEDDTAQTDLGSSETTEDSNEPVELTVWGWDAAFNGYALEQADAAYEGATINFVEMAKGDALQKLHTVLASNVTEDLPDIVIISDLAAQGYLMSYPDAFLPVDNYINYSDFASYKQPMLSYDDVGYGVPFDTGVAALFYRTDYVEEVGYTDEDMQNLTWDEYIELGEKLKEKGHLLQTYNPNDISEFQIMLQSAGSWYTDENGEADFVDNDALLESIDIFKTFNDSDFVKVVSDWTGFTGAINGGEVACVIRGSWISSTIKAEESQSGLWKVAPIPTLSVEGATNSSNQGGSSWFVLKNGKNPEAAAEFLASTFGKDVDLYNTLLSEANIMATYLPASDAPAFETPDPFFSDTLVNKTLAEFLATIPPVDTGMYTAEAQAAILAVMPDILNGADVDASLEQAEKQFEQTIQ